MSAASHEFEGSLQHHDFFLGGHVTYPRCESCMWGSHYETVTWHSWVGDEDLEAMPEDQHERVLKQKCACDCAGPREKTS